MYTVIIYDAKTDKPVLTIEADTKEEANTIEDGFLSQNGLGVYTDIVRAEQ